MILYERMSVVRPFSFRSLVTAGRLCAAILWTATLWAATAVAQTAAPSLDPSLPFDKYVLDTWTTEDGLPNATIEAILQTRDGYLWLGTRGGLVRFDGARFTVFDRTVVPGFLSNSVDVLEEGRDGSLWAGLKQGGLHRLRGGTWEHFDTESGLSHNTITTLHETSDGELLIGTALGVDRWDGEKILSLDACPIRVSGFGETPDGNIWVLGDGELMRVQGNACMAEPDRPTLSTNVDESGEPWLFFIAHDATRWWGPVDGNIFRTSPDGGETVLVRQRVEEEDSRVICFLEDRRGTIWAGTISGLVRFSGGIATVFSETEGIVDKRVLSLFEDREGSLWIGTYAGLNRLKRSRFKTITAADGLAGDNVLTALEDSQGGVWIGSNQGLDRYSRGVLERIPTADGSPQYDVRSLLEDSQGMMWIGTEHGLFQLDRKRGERSQRRYPGDAGLASIRIDAIAETRAGAIWVGLTPTGAIRLDREGPVEELYLGGSPALSIHQDHRGDLWFASTEGLHHRRGTSLTRYPPEGDPQTYYIREIRENPPGIFWLGTVNSGLLRFENGRFTAINTSHGLHDDHVWHSVEDEQGILWMCSDRGLFTAVRRELDEFARGERTSISSVSYGLSDGLKNLECNGLGNPSGIHTADGRIWFTTAGGVVIVDPKNLQLNPVLPNVLIEEIQIDGMASDQLGPDRTEELVVPTDARQIEIHFTATSLLDPSRVRFRYRLESYDRDWMEADSRRWAVYGNLPPGRYRFHVKASNNDGLWNEEGAALWIDVPPPLWRTWWAFTLYVLTLAAIVAAYVRVQRIKLEQERGVSRRLREVDQLKDEFLANTSHELRTPLYGMTGLAESLVDGARGDLPDDVKADLTMITASGRRLSHLVGDILDFSKLRHNSLVLKCRPVDLYALTEIILTLSHPLIGAKDLTLRNAIPGDLPAVFADENRLQQILYNLVGNAIKFTESGKVEVSAAAEGTRVTVRVIDTGIGITPAARERIFEAFQQADASVERQHGGTGLGLAVTRQLVELHGGELEVRSALDEGSTFFFSLPPAGSSPEPEGAPARAQPVVPDTSASLEKPSNDPEPHSGQKAVILVVDDEPINLQVLRNYLSLAGFELVLASTGTEALSLLEERSFDLVLLDVMMPKMSGYEVCRQIRETHPLEKLPILFLSAMDRVSDRVTGLDQGGNDYLTKPIVRSELISRVMTHLSLLEANRLQEREVVSLRGLLPICVSCKSVRDDEGYWNRIESYISARSEAEFTHGICPTCAEKLYPGILDSQNKESEESS